MELPIPKACEEKTLTNLCAFPKLTIGRDRDNVVPVDENSRPHYRRKGKCDI